MQNFDHPLKQLLIVGIIEAITLLLLMFVAMPLKYMAGWQNATMVLGTLHGVGFILYVVLLIENVTAEYIGIWHALVSFIACMIPFGPFFVDRSIRRKLANLQETGVV